MYPEEPGVLLGRRGRIESVAVLTKHGSSSFKLRIVTLDGDFLGLKYALYIPTVGKIMTLGS